MSEDLPDEIVWAICPYMLGRDDDPCMKCPHVEDFPGHGMAHRGCRVAAEDALLAVFRAAEALGYAIVPSGCEEKMMAAYHRKLGTTGEYQKHDAIRAAIEAVRLTR